MNVIIISQLSDIAKHIKLRVTVNKAGVPTVKCQTCTSTKVKKSVLSGYFSYNVSLCNDHLVSSALNVNGQY